RGWRRPGQLGRRLRGGGLHDLEGVLALAAAHGEALRADPGVIDLVACLALVAADFHRWFPSQEKRSTIGRDNSTVKRLGARAGATFLLDVKLTEPGPPLGSAGGSRGGLDGSKVEGRPARLEAAG